MLLLFWLANSSPTPNAKDKQTTRAHHLHAKDKQTTREAHACRSMTFSAAASVTCLPRRRTPPPTRSSTTRGQPKPHVLEKIFLAMCACAHRSPATTAPLCRAPLRPAVPLRGTPPAGARPQPGRPRRGRCGAAPQRSAASAGRRLAMRRRCRDARRVGGTPSRRRAAADADSSDAAADGAVVDPALKANGV